MNAPLKQHIAEIATDDRTGTATAAGTIAAGLATSLDWIPANIGNLGVLMGVVLSATLVVVNIRAEIRKTKLDKLQEHMGELRVAEMERDSERDDPHE